MREQAERLSRDLSGDLDPQPRADQQKTQTNPAVVDQQAPKHQVQYLLTETEVAAETGHPTIEDMVIRHRHRKEHQNRDRDQAGDQDVARRRDQRATNKMHEQRKDEAVETDIAEPV